ncbi:MAG: beta-propeller domain-containing protein, partial [Polyangiales bacterium]
MRKFTEMLCLALVGGSIGCTTTPEVSQYEAALTQATSCEDVLGAVQQDAIAKVDLELESFINQEYYNRWGGPFEGDVALDGGTGGSGGPAPTAGPGQDGAEAPTGFSDTNRQVGDVDEADIVKVGAEGLKLFVIRGNGFYEFDSWPASQMSKVADLEIEGGAIEMFVEGDRAVVFSNAYGVEALDDGDLCQGYYGGGAEPALADID